MGWFSSGRAKPLVLVVDDEPLLREAMCTFLDRRGFDVVTAGSCAEANARLGKDAPDAYLMDLKLPDGDSLEILPHIRAKSATAPIILLSGFGTIDLAVRALKGGATHFFTKPAPMKDIAEMLFDCLESASGRASSNSASASGAGAARASGAMSARAPFVGRSPAMRRVYEELERIAHADCPVLILGETGTGKSLLAAHLHASSPRASRAFVDVNCGGLSSELAQSELFGHERGAFTGALTTKVGLFESAHLGTLFLDEIGDIDASVQAHILKALEEKRFRRLGETRERAADVRLVAATHRDLAESMQRQAFRTDLYYRISGFCVTVPPLRDRLEDLPGLARHLVEDVCARAERPAPELNASARAALASHPWRGNVRELRNVLERAVWLHRGTEIDATDIRFDPIERPLGKDSGVYPRRALGSDPSISAGGRTMRDVERDAIVEALRANAGHFGETARALGIPRSTLYQKLKALGVTTSRRVDRTAGGVDE